jgi:hypothetical protein
LLQMYCPLGVASMLSWCIICKSICPSLCLCSSLLYLSVLHSLLLHTKLKHKSMSQWCNLQSMINGFSRHPKTSRCSKWIASVSIDADGTRGAYNVWFEVNLAYEAKRDLTSFGVRLELDGVNFFHAKSSVNDKIDKAFLLLIPW